MPTYTLPEAAAIATASSLDNINVLTGKVGVFAAATTTGQSVLVEIGYVRNPDKSVSRQVQIRDLSGALLNISPLQLLLPKTGRDIKLPIIRLTLTTSYSILGSALTTLDPACNYIYCYTPAALVYNDDGGNTGNPIRADSYFKLTSREEINAAHLRTVSGGAEIIINPYITL